MYTCRCVISILLTFVMVVALAVVCRAETIVRHVDVPRPVITCSDDRCGLFIDGFPSFGNPGEPVLPTYTLSILLPQGEEVAGLEVNAGETEEIEVDLPLEWGQPQAPLSMDAAWEAALADPSIYESARPYPAAQAVHVTTQTYRGYNIAFLRIYPLRYVGGDKVLLYSSSIEITMETSPSGPLLVRSLGTLRDGAFRDIAEVENLVDDMSAARSYAAERHPKLLGALVEPGDSYPYVILTNATLKPVFEALKDHRDRRGVRTRIVRIQEIVWNYEGADLQERIRKFIRDAYLNWETEYVLLGGDDEIIPHRGLYAEILPYVTDNDIPADIYYAALDGTWNDDYDARWGEPGEDDLLPEVSVARASVSTVTEATNFVNKIIRYETAPVVGQIKIAQTAGELVYVDDGEPTWGADEKDEVKDGSSAHGFTTAGFPPSFTVHTLYDRDLYPDEWSGADLISLMNSGRHLINHAGHCINWMCMKISTSQIPTSFTNDGITNSYLVIYAHGCYSAAFDNRTTDGSYVGDAVAEYFTYIENGAVSYIGNTRYGCGFHGDTRSAAQYYDRQFFDALFGEGITAIGKAQDDSKIDNIPYIDFRGMRWTYYTLTLIGDPAMDIWTDTPGSLSVSMPEAVYVSENEVVIGVTDGSLPVPGARVSIYGDSSYCCHGYTDETGFVYLDPDAAQPGSLYVAVLAHNFYAHLDTLSVVDAAHALVVIETFTIDDDDSGGSSGNSDGRVDAGETIESPVSLRNVGLNPATDVSGTLRTADPYVTLIDSSRGCPDIPPGDVATPIMGYIYDVSPSIPDSHLIEFTLEVAYSDTSVVRHFSTPACAPLLYVISLAVGDTLHGNGDGCIEAGETVELALSLVNLGSGGGSGVSIELSENDAYATIGAGSAYVASIAPGGQAVASPACLVTILPDCPAHHRLDLNVAMESANGRQMTDSTAVYVGGLVDQSFESGTSGWTHTDIVKGFVDQWHLEGYRNHTAGGTYCWKFGGPGPEGYAHYAHGALMTPQLCLGTNATLTFWHWIQVELEGGDYASDGGIVEVTTDGGKTWGQITPAGGYPHRIYPGTSTPIPPETPCFAWTNDWTQVQFDLASYQGPVRIRFNFGGGEHFESEEGWYVDDITVTDDMASVILDDEDLNVVPVRFAITSVNPNPVSSDVAIAFDVPYTSSVSIKAFDIRGRLLGTIAEGIFAAGRHSETWRLGPEHSPGVYFIRMRAPGFTQTKKLVLCR
jgi:hypothetical protein